MTLQLQKEVGSAELSSKCEREDLSRYDPACYPILSLQEVVLSM
jgi:hypothetical protein